VKAGVVKAQQRHLRTFLEGTGCRNYNKFGGSGDPKPE
jgi:hypothetical protein